MCKLIHSTYCCDVRISGCLRLVVLGQASEYEVMTPKELEPVLDKCMLDVGATAYERISH